MANDNPNIPNFQYYPENGRIIHETMIDIKGRPMSNPIHLVQYDDKLPILAIKLYDNGEPYILPINYSGANIRWGKRDRTFVYNPCLGTDSTRTILYFEVTVQMVTEWGEFHPIIEFVNIIDDYRSIAGTSPLHVIDDRNPIQQDDIESSIEYKTVEGLAEEAEQSAQDAESAANMARGYADLAYSYGESARNAADDAEEAAQESLSASNNSKAYSDLSHDYYDDIREMVEHYGSPLKAQLVSQMTDRNRVYVYTGSETGYIYGHWYFWNSVEWADGGPYNAPFNTVHIGPNPPADSAVQIWLDTDESADLLRSEEGSY